MAPTDPIADSGLPDRDAYQDALAAQLVEWRAQFEGLHAQVARAVNGRPRGGKAFKVLAARHAALLRCLREVRDATDLSWQEWRARTDKAWDELQAATEEARASLPNGRQIPDDELDLLVPSGRLQPAGPD